jgi:hypothetical protein
MYRGRSLRGTAHTWEALPRHQPSSSPRKVATTPSSRIIIAGRNIPPPSPLQGRVNPRISPSSRRPGGSACVLPPRAISASRDSECAPLPGHGATPGAPHGGVACMRNEGRRNGSCCSCRSESPSAHSFATCCQDDAITVPPSVDEGPHPASGWTNHWGAGECRRIEAVRGGVEATCPLRQNLEESPWRFRRCSA